MGNAANTRAVNKDVDKYALEPGSDLYINATPKAKGKCNSTEQWGDKSLISLPSEIRKDYLEDVPIPELLDSPIRGRSEQEIFQNRLYDVNHFPAIKTAFEKDHTSRIADKYAIFLYKHVWLKKPEDNMYVDWTSGQNLRNFPLVIIPCRLKASGGFVREWSQIADGDNVVPGIRKTKDKEQPTSINGFMQMAYSEEEFKAMQTFFAMSGRAGLVSIDIKHFEQAGWEALPQVKTCLVVVPRSDFTKRASAKYPIMQSYLDSLLVSYMEVQDLDFATEFMRTTKGWNECWINDRLHPRRPWIGCKSWRSVDKLCMFYPKMSPNGNNAFFHRRCVSNVVTLAGNGVTGVQQEHYSVEGNETYAPKVWMFGYGSLINTISRLSSSPQANNVIPCVVSSKANLKRLWNYRARPKGSQVGAKFVALGVEKTKPGEGADMNGIVYPLSKGTTMDQIREREKGYEFIHINREHIKEYATVLCWQKIPKDAEIWMCGPALDPAYVCEPSAPFPILQTYVDVCISGCLEHDTQFAEMFVATTTGWSKYFLNDREVPRRPWVSNLHSQQEWKQIDTILGDDLLKFRTLTGEYGAIHGQDLATDFKSTHKRLSLLGPDSPEFSNSRGSIFNNPNEEKKYHR